MAGYVRRPHYNGRSEKSPKRIEDFRQPFGRGSSGGALPPKGVDVSVKKEEVEGRQLAPGQKMVEKLPMTAEEYIQLKSFSRPSWLITDDPYPIVVPANGTVPAIAKITSDHDFEVCKIMSSHTGDYIVEITDTSTGRKLMNRPIHVVGIAGNAGLPFVLCTTLFLNRSAGLQLTFTDLSGAENTIYFMMHGVSHFYREALNLTAGLPSGDYPEYLRMP